MPAAATHQAPALSRQRSSRLELEPNPFEASFKSPEGDGLDGGVGKSAETSSTSPSKGKRAGAPSTTRTRSSARNAAAAKAKEDTGNAADEAPNNSKGSVPSTQVSAAAASINGKAAIGGSTLPGVATLTSPSGDAASPFNWINGSLRTGPLSPAMLGGPSASAQGFDPSAFRTGFTPDLSNYKTGLTPLGGISFQPPSPNTAAFLAIVSNGSNGVAVPGNGGSAAMTPNTLNALAASAPGLADTTAPSTMGPPGTSVVGQFNSHARADIVPQPFDYAFSRSIHDKPTSRLRSSTTHEDDGSHSVSPEMINKSLGAEATGTRGAIGHRSDGSLMNPNRAGNAQGRSGQGVQGQGPGGPGEPGADHGAASGLFLLSQAQQELSKREDADAAAHAAAQALTGIPRRQAPPQPPQHHQQQQQKQQPQHAHMGHQRPLHPAAVAMYTNGMVAPAGTTQTSKGAGGKSANKRKKANDDEGGKPGGKSGKAGAGADAATVPAGGKGSKKLKSDSGGALVNSSAANAAHSKAGSSEAASDDDMDDGDSKNEQDLDEDEKRRNFLERNRQAALKCRQRKKAWLQSLQAKVEFLTQDNESLQNTVGALRNEIVYLKTQLMHANAQMLSVASATQANGPAPAVADVVAGRGPVPPVAGAVSEAAGAVVATGAGGHGRPGRAHPSASGVPGAGPSGAVHADSAGGGGATGTTMPPGLQGSVAGLPPANPPTFEQSTVQRTGS
ncbi:hypothetical protein K437DRAFT_253963 [Tilletiaria anomala UBC 951]|uniref:BZIP domain-containing protein n=1 Tax=Tilletiaria anomala (strain ATCC 24038 / CBS 436.72 / UBC 951) TaxID=1037660 RepID=A0A066WP19_TILAU|nr:uncharacterized protein K437DRAFT_253963 [Tilletiaria anomala UBC 951]KDN52759.1 hypothetical protein K437DRAFT_253963 [Tilletiaria anomala UBC 951]